MRIKLYLSKKLLWRLLSTTAEFFQSKAKLIAGARVVLPLQAQSLQRHSFQQRRAASKPKQYGSLPGHLQLLPPRPQPKTCTVLSLSSSDCIFSGHGFCKN